jgi:hypothetical protein
MLAKDTQLQLVGPPVAVPGTTASNIVFYTAIMKWTFAQIVTIA